MSLMNTLIGNVWDKIDALPLTFDFSENDLIPCINDAIREMGIPDVSVIQPMSRMELFAELRAMWYFLMRARNSASANFKYSTGSDGKTIDKTEIGKAIGRIMADLDAQFTSGWRSSSGGAGGRTWTMTKRTSDTLQGV